MAAVNGNSPLGRLSYHKRAHLRVLAAISHVLASTIPQAKRLHEYMKILPTCFVVVGKTAEDG
jgi:hypothetical protein